MLLPLPIRGSKGDSLKGVALLVLSTRVFAEEIVKGVDLYTEGTGWRAKESVFAGWLSRGETQHSAPGGRILHEEFVMQRRSLSPAAAVKTVKERTLPIDKDVFAERLWSAIKRSGLTYKETARRAQEELPSGARISDVSVWSYAKGRSLPRRMTHVEALSKVLGIDTHELLTTGAHPARAPDTGDGDGAVHVEDLGDGRAFLRIAQPLPWQIAVEILRLVKAGPDAEDAAPQEAGARSALADSDMPADALAEPTSASDDENRG